MNKTEKLFDNPPRNGNRREICHKFNKGKCSHELHCKYCNIVSMTFVEQYATSLVMGLTSSEKLVADSTMRMAVIIRAVIIVGTEGKDLKQTQKLDTK